MALGTQTRLTGTVTSMRMMCWNAHPGVKRRLADAIRRAYRRARIDAAGETGLDESAFPAECSYDFEAIMNRPISWPLEGDASGT